MARVKRSFSAPKSIGLLLVASTLGSWLGSALNTGAIDTGVALADVSIPPEIPDPEALKAFKEYWSAFEAYEDRLRSTGQKKFKDAWAEIKSSYRKEQQKISAEELVELQKAAAKYRKHLEQHPAADNRPFVMLNLAQI